MANARIVDAADAAANLLVVLATDSTIRRGNVPIREQVDLSGRYIDVYDLSHRPDVERVTRAEVIDEYEVSAVYTREYTGTTKPDASEPIPQSWVDTEKYYVEQNIEDVLGDKDNRLLSSALYPWSIQYVPEGVVYDPDILLEHKVFRSEIRVVYRELVSG